MCYLWYLTVSNSRRNCRDLQHIKCISCCMYYDLSKKFHLSNEMYGVLWIHTHIHALPFLFSFPAFILSFPPQHRNQQLNWSDTSSVQKSPWWEGIGGGLWSVLRRGGGKRFKSKVIKNNEAVPPSSHWSKGAKYPFKLGVPAPQLK